MYFNYPFLGFNLKWEIAYYIETEIASPIVCAQDGIK